MAIILKPIFKKVTFVSTVYGLEMTIKNSFARTLINAGINSCDRVATISENTLDIMKDYISPDKVTIIYVGVEPPQIDENEIKKLRLDFEEQYSINFEKEKVLLNFGRMVPRKGVARFIKEGFPLLPSDIRLILGGSGPDYEKIKATIEELKLQDRVILLNRPSDEIVAMLRNSADLFIMPNVKYENDVEGYGMAQLESMYSGMPVVAFAVDALVESVRTGGYLIEPENYKMFTDTIVDYFNLSDDEKSAKREEASSYVKREYSWEKTSDDYIALFEKE
jgi:glycosyltransferase involved in cell wall biosynthesis